jgi:hypothetical protein
MFPNNMVVFADVWAPHLTDFITNSTLKLLKNKEKRCLQFDIIEQKS